MHLGSLHDIQIAVTITAYHSDMGCGTSYAQGTTLETPLPFPSGVALMRPLPYKRAWWEGTKCLSHEPPAVGIDLGLGFNVGSFYHFVQGI